MNYNNSKKISLLILLVLSIFCTISNAEDIPTSFADAQKSVQQKLEDSVEELNNLREQISSEKLPLSKKLTDLENSLLAVRLEYQQASRLLDSRTLDLSNLRTEIKSRKDEAAYLSNLINEYIRNFESRLHIAEIQRYRSQLDAAKLAAENTNLSEREVYYSQSQILQTAIDRLDEAIGGYTFEGTAVDPTGLVNHGKFVMVGPIAVFMSNDGNVVGTVEQRLGSLEPAVVAFGNPLDIQACIDLITNDKGYLPLDPTMGNAHKIEETKETLLEHIKKGGPVMYPIFALAGCAMLVAAFKWLNIVFIRTPSQKKLDGLLKAISDHNEKEAKQRAKAIRGPVGKILQAGIDHIKEPRELIEEVMYEKILARRLKLERFLPFVAISASSAPLLGLLGTVTGIINTFKLITVFGSGDVKTLSGGISEALITTEYGLIVAIPSLLVHAFLSRKVRNIVNQMEKAAVALINQVSKTPYHKPQEKDCVFEKLTPQEIKQALAEASFNRSHPVPSTAIEQINYPVDSAGSIMDSNFISAAMTDTIANTISKIRQTQGGHQIDCIFIVDGGGKYISSVPTGQLLAVSEQSSIGQLVENRNPAVRVDEHKNQANSLLASSGLSALAVLDYNDRIVGRISRNGSSK